VLLVQEGFICPMDFLCLVRKLTSASALEICEDHHPDECDDVSAEALSFLNLPRGRRHDENRLFADITI